MTAPRTVELFAGPGGWDEGALALGVDLESENASGVRIRSQKVAN